MLENCFAGFPVPVFIMIVKIINMFFVFGKASNCMIFQSRIFVTHYLIIQNFVEITIIKRKDSQSINLLFHCIIEIWNMSVK